MEPVTTILGGIVIATISGVVGKSIGDNNNIKNKHCNEKQISCQKLLIEKIENLSEKVDNIHKIVNSKLFSV